MSARAIAARAIGAYQERLKAGAENPEREAADIAAFEGRDLVREVVLTVSECLADGKSELFALAVAQERFAAPAPASPPLPPSMNETDEGTDE